jgi:DNA polymerase V
MYFLADATAYYSSAEMVFEPALRNKPLLIVGSNDGVVIALSPQAKRLGLKKFEPVFLQQDLIRKTGAVVRSANFELYGELSKRMHSIIAEYGQNYPYSIDESFCKLPIDGSADCWAIGRSIRRRVWDELRIPMCIGFGRTLTLAKAANHASKRLPGFRGVAVINSEEERRHILSSMACTDVWGVGSRIGHRLKLFNINDALSLANASVKDMKSAFNINVANTVEELNGLERLFWDDVRKPKQQIFSTRSVSRPIQTLDTLTRVLSSHALNVCRKAREQKSLIVQMVVFARTSPFRQDAAVSVNSVITFNGPTSCYKKVASAVRLHTEAIYQPGLDFIKIGAGAITLVDEVHSISDLFDDRQDDIATSSVMDLVNKRFGRGTVTLGSVLKTDPATHLVSRNNLSPPYLSNWNHIPKIICK